MSCCSASDKLPCPSKMEDGRAFTDYRPRCNVNADLLENLTKNNMINSSYESRLYLQQNADKIMQMDRDNAIKNLLPCNPSNPSNPSNPTMLPEKYIVKCDHISCSRVEINPDGLGDGRMY